MYSMSFYVESCYNHSRLYVINILKLQANVWNFAYNIFYQYKML